jgi:hypothetical protein
MKHIVRVIINSRKTAVFFAVAIPWIGTKTKSPEKKGVVTTAQAAANILLILIASSRWRKKTTDEPGFTTFPARTRAAVVGNRRMPPVVGVDVDVVMTT